MKESKTNSSTSVKGGKGIWFKFLMYTVVVVLINIVGVTLFFRVDLTKNGMYSISSASRKVVSTLSEPLSIKVFFTKNLPAPYNNTERYLHDLLEEYAAKSGKLFNYRFYDVTASEAGITKQANVNRDMAEDYGISPVQIRVIENDEVKFQQAYMGLVIIHGDMLEKIPAITSTDGLEYTITSSIQKLNNKVSALLALKDKIKITLYLSSSLEKVAPLMGLEDLSSLPGKIEKVVEKLNAKSMGKIEYSHVDPSKNEDIDALSKKYDLMALKWPEIPQKGIAAGSGGAGIVMQYREKIKTTPVITSIKIPIIGTTYQMVDPEALDELFSRTMETMIGINQSIGYLSDHGTPALADYGMNMPGMPQSSMNAFNELITKRYSVEDVKLKDGGSVPEGLKTLIIARPTEPFSDYELFQIDQALMRGTNIALFLDEFNEVMGQQMSFGGGPQYLPINTGLEKLLEHYGVKIDPSYVLDESCYKQTKQANQGGGEQKIYFAPIIKDSNINSDPLYMKNIKGIISMRISPIELDEKKAEQSGITAEKLFSSSDKSWLMKDNINLNPMFIHPPTDPSEMKSHALAYMLSGEFTSYFAGKPVPQKDVDKKDQKKDIKAPEGEGNISESNTEDMKQKVMEENKNELAGFQVENNMISKGKSGKIFVMSCASMLQDNMLDPEGRSSNATFIFNVIDHLNDQDDIAVMRSKIQTLNPLAETSPFARAFIKVFNIAGLPVLVILFGLGVWARRASRKRTIRILFQK